jgi:hypothetical protein
MQTQEREQRRKIRSIASSLSSKSPARREHGRAALDALDDASLIRVARVQLGRYQCVTAIRRAEETVTAACIGIGFLLLTLMGANEGVPVALLVGIVALMCGVLLIGKSRRPVPGRRQLEGMIPTLTAIKSRLGAMLRITDIWPSIDRTTAAHMRLRCPDLNDLLPEFLAPASLSSEQARVQQIRNHYFLQRPFEVIAYTLAALQDLEAFGDETFIPAVRELAEMQSARLRLRMPLDNPEAVTIVRQAAERCLAVLESREELVPRLLLRGVSAPGDDTLLRAADSAVDEPPEQLLRASNHDE